MMRTLKALVGRLRRSKDADRDKAALEAEREVADARLDSLVDVQSREVTRG